MASGGRRPNAAVSRLRRARQERALTVATVVILGLGIAELAIGYRSPTLADAVVATATATVPGAPRPPSSLGAVRPAIPARAVPPARSGARAPSPPAPAPSAATGSRSAAAAGMPPATPTTASPQAPAPASAGSPAAGVSPAVSPAAVLSSGSAVAPAAGPVTPPPIRATSPSGYGCAAALAYLAANQAPGFTDVCAPASAGPGNAGLTVGTVNQGVVTGGTIYIACPAPIVYQNEASNSWKFSGATNAPFDPWGGVPWSQCRPGDIAPR